MRLPVPIMIECRPLANGGHSDFSRGLGDLRPCARSRCLEHLTRMGNSKDFPTVASAIRFGAAMGIVFGIGAGFFAGALFGDERDFVGGAGVGLVWIVIYVAALGIGRWRRRGGTAAGHPATVQSGSARSSFLRRLAADDKFNDNLAINVMSDTIYGVLGSVYLAIERGVDVFYRDSLICILFGAFLIIALSVTSLAFMSFCHWRRSRHRPDRGQSSLPFN